MTTNYANEWDKSSEFFFNMGYYSWMSAYLKNYKRVLEVGCGTGYGTLSLVKEGHEVIVIEKDHDCISRAKALISDNGYSDYVNFIEADIIFDFDINAIFDVVICWNPGIGNVEYFENYIPYLLKYGLTQDQILGNYSSSYSEYLVWRVSQIAKDAEVPFHLIDRCRETHNPEVEGYYNDIKNEIGFTKIEINYLKGESLSDAGVPLNINGKNLTGNVIPVVLSSVLMY